MPQKSQQERTDAVRPTLLAAKKRWLEESMAEQLIKDWDTFLHESERSDCVARAKAAALATAEASVSRTDSTEDAWKAWEKGWREGWKTETANILDNLRKASADEFEKYDKARRKKEAKKMFSEPPLISPHWFSGSKEEWLRLYDKIQPALIRASKRGFMRGYTERFVELELWGDLTSIERCQAMAWREADWREGRGGGGIADWIEGFASGWRDEYREILEEKKEDPFRRSTVKSMPFEALDCGSDHYIARQFDEISRELGWGEVMAWQTAEEHRAWKKGFEMGWGKRLISFNDQTTCFSAARQQAEAYVSRNGFSANGWTWNWIEGWFWEQQNRTETGSQAVGTYKEGWYKQMRELAVCSDINDDYSEFNRASNLAYAKFKEMTLGFE